VALFRTGIDPWSAGVLRPLVGALLLIPFLRAGRRRSRPPSDPGVPPRSPWVGPLGAALLGGIPFAVFQVVYALSTDRVGVPATVALLYLSPALILALQGPLFGERPSRAQVAVAAVSVAGVWLVVLGGGQGLPVGGPGELVWGLLTGASFAAYILFGRWMAPQIGSVAALTWSTLGAAGLLLGAALVTGRPPELPGSPAAWGILVVLAAATIPLASILFFGALVRIDPGKASVGATVEPLVGTLLAGLFLGQTLGPTGWVGMALLVAGVAATSMIRTGEG
jgi:drug/metabolite transporter, DME family